jgi:hypothetical protein
MQHLQILAAEFSATSQTAQPTVAIQSLVVMFWVALHEL